MAAIALSGDGRLATVWPQFRARSALQLEAAASSLWAAGVTGVTTRNSI